MAVITNGAVLLNITQYYQQVIIGVIIWLAVWWDQVRRGAVRAIGAASERRTARARDDGEPRSPMRRERLRPRSPRRGRGVWQLRG